MTRVVIFIEGWRVCVRPGCGGSLYTQNCHRDTEHTEKNQLKLSDLWVSVAKLSYPFLMLIYSHEHNIIHGMQQIIPTAEPFFFLGDSSKPACLLIHGFTGTPKEMRWMGEFLNQQGYNCLGIRLTGHATDPEDMIRSRWTDWVASVEDGYQFLRGLSDTIFLIGLSMGGSLSLLMSTRLNVKGVVAMSTPYKLPDDPRLRYLDLIARAIPFMPKSKEEPGVSWFDKE